MPRQATGTAWRMHDIWSTPGAVVCKQVRARVPNIDGGATIPPTSTSVPQRHLSDQPLSAASAPGAAPWHSQPDRAQLKATGASLTRTCRCSLIHSRSSDTALGDTQRGKLSGRCEVSPTKDTCPSRSTGCRTSWPPLDTTTSHQSGTSSENRRVRCRPRGVFHRRGRGLDKRGRRAPPLCQKQSGGISHRLP